jgi:hypothetical protein
LDRALEMRSVRSSVASLALSRDRRGRKNTWIVERSDGGLLTDRDAAVVGV